jgi:hypothetical protein
LEVGDVKDETLPVYDVRIDLVPLRMFEEIIITFEKMWRDFLQMREHLVNISRFYIFIHLKKIVLFSKKIRIIGSHEHNFFS